ncbi:MAG: twin-arginine translocase TatA/TatE family subunit [Acidimicrobiales bacterium]
MPSLGPQELLIILLIVLVLFGGRKLPDLAKNLGQAQREFKAGLDDGAETAKPDTAKSEITKADRSDDSA